MISAVVLVESSVLYLCANAVPRLPHLIIPSDATIVSIVVSDSYLFAAVFRRVRLVAVIRILVRACRVVVPRPHECVGGGQVLNGLVFLGGGR